MTSARTALLCVLVLGVGRAPASDARAGREAIARGNALFAEGRFDEALKAYESAADDVPADQAAELLHNRAAALFKLGRIADARELWVRAAAMRDAPFEARTRYNLGNCGYAEALRALEAGDRTGALERLGVAAQQYRDAVRIDPTLADARANLELAHQLMQRIRETTPPASQPQSQHASQPQSQPQPQPASQPQSDRAQRAATGPAEGEPSTRPQGAESAPSSQAQAEPDESQAEPTPQSQPAPAPGAPVEPEAASQPSDGPREPGAPTLELSREQAERLLQKVRDLERARRRMLMLREAARYQPVDRDW